MGPVIVIFFAFVLPAFIIGFNVWRIVAYYRRTGRFIKVTGRVIGNSVQQGSRRRATYYAPIVEFETTDGSLISAVYSQDNPDRSLYIPGEAITICYDPREPRRFIIHDPKAEYLVSAIGILVGLVYFFFVAKAFWF